MSANPNHLMIDRNKNCDEIEICDEGTTIFAHDKSYRKIVVPNTCLKWRNPCEDDNVYDLPMFLMLKEIGEQLFSLGYEPVFYVWHEQGLSGKIYQYGNYQDDQRWVEHGVTKGYA
ncbi:MAG: hypothetical protein FWF05_08465 [Oscillospiraceae bacterium]|nr:hypothetical protein [Oscillospiraceae bacterium]